MNSQQWRRGWVRERNLRSAKQHIRSTSCWVDKKIFPAQSKRISRNKIQPGEKGLKCSKHPPSCSTIYLFSTVQKSRLPLGERKIWKISKIWKKHIFVVKSNPKAKVSYAWQLYEKFKLGQIWSCKGSHQYPVWPGCYSSLASPVCVALVPDSTASTPPRWKPWPWHPWTLWKPVIPNSSHSFARLAYDSKWRSKKVALRKVGKMSWTCFFYNPGVGIPRPTLVSIQPALFVCLGPGLATMGFPSKAKIELLNLKCFKLRKTTHENKT